MITDELIEMAIKDKLNIKNIVAFYQIGKVFNLPDLYKSTFSYIVRCFTMVVERNNFLYLDYNCISKILASSELLITSEVEVFNAANLWLNYDIKERCKLAKNLLLKVRLPLLSDNALRNLLYKPSLFTKIYESRSILENCLNDKTIIFQTKSSIYYTNRYCNQTNFDVLVCGGRSRIYGCDSVKKVIVDDANNFQTCKALPSMIEGRYSCNAVCLNGEIYVFGGRSAYHEWNLSVEKYSPDTKSWIRRTNMPDNRESFSVCAFMDKVFIIGGFCRDDGRSTDTTSCLQFDTKAKNRSWKKVTGMNERRTSAACAVFEGRIVASGGKSGINMGDLSTVETYDVFGNEWSSLPNMIKPRSRHNMVVVRDKLFVIGEGTNSCELFDKTCNKFVALKSKKFNGYHQVVSIGETIYVFESHLYMYSYDVSTDKWSQKSCGATNSLIRFCCVKVHSY